MTTNHKEEETAVMNDLKLRFGTNTNDIDANTLINSIVHFSNLIQQVNRELKTNRKIEVKIKAFEPGSFIVNIILESDLISTVKNLFVRDNITIASELITIVGGLYGVFKIFKGEDPKVIESNVKGVKIMNTFGNATYIDNRVFNIYNSPGIRSTVAKEFETLNNDEDVQSFEIIDNENSTPIVKFDRSEFSDLSTIESSLTESSRTITKEATLHIITLSFDKKKKWEFLYDGNKISSKIDDEVFHTHIDGGEAFSKGDTLTATLEIYQKYNELAEAYGNHSYKVIQISKHKKRGSQNSLFE